MTHEIAKQPTLAQLIETIPSYQDAVACASDDLQYAEETVSNAIILRTTAQSTLSAAQSDLKEALSSVFGIVASPDSTLSPTFGKYYLEYLRYTKTAHTQSTLLRTESGVEKYRELCDNPGSLFLYDDAAPVAFFGYLHKFPELNFFKPSGAGIIRAEVVLQAKNKTNPPKKPFASIPLESLGTIAVGLDNVSSRITETASALEHSSPLPFESEGVGTFARGLRIVKSLSSNQSILEGDLHQEFGSLVDALGGFVLKQIEGKPFGPMVENSILNIETAANMYNFYLWSARKSASIQQSEWRKKVFDQLSLRVAQGLQTMPYQVLNPLVNAIIAEQTGSNTSTMHQIPPRSTIDSFRVLNWLGRNGRNLQPKTSIICTDTV